MMSGQGPIESEQNAPTTAPQDHESATTCNERYVTVRITLTSLIVRSGYS